MPSGRRQGCNKISSSSTLPKYEASIKPGRGQVLVHCLGKTLCFKSLQRWLECHSYNACINSQQKIELLSANALSDQLTNYTASCGLLDALPSNSRIHRPIQFERPRANHAAPPTGGSNCKLYQLIKQIRISTSRWLCEPSGVMVYHSSNSFSLDERKPANILSSAGKFLTLIAESALLLSTQLIRECRGIILKHSIRSSRESTSSAFTAAKR